MKRVAVAVLLLALLGVASCGKEAPAPAVMPKPDAHDEREALAGFFTQYRYGLSLLLNRDGSCVYWLNDPRIPGRRVSSFDYEGTWEKDEQRVILSVQPAQTQPPNVRKQRMVLEIVSRDELRSEHAEYPKDLLRRRSVKTRR